ncbi:hypothetical protein HPB51_029648 [Rhipicephalus microplus]|uniref:Uncharacterized protein n=1 Tax=Rhipicephalus microplus TaxID=6941 RepID=A0A9J6CUC4_RHIMP|nr:hypothetical protein HPB51_029648 [Rhipicephalus microplus]
MCKVHLTCYGTTMLHLHHFTSSIRCTIPIIMSDLKKAIKFIKRTCGTTIPVRGQTLPVKPASKQHKRLATRCRDQKCALSERKTKPAPRRPDYPWPWNTRPPTKDAKKGAARAMTRVNSQSPGTGPPSKVGETRIQAQIKAEFTKEILRLGALCESRTKELTMLKLQLRHASAGFASFAVVVQHLHAQVLQNNSFRIPKLSEESWKSQDEIEKARIAIEVYKNKIEELKQSHEKKINSLRKELEASHKKRTKELKEAHQNELTGYLEAHTRKLEKMKAFYADALDNSRKNSNETLDAMKQRQRENIDAINEEYSLQTDSINEDHQARQKELQQRYEALQQQYKQLQQQAREFQESVLSDTDAKIQWLSKKNADLQKQVESLNVVLEMRANQMQNLQHAKLELEQKKEELDRCKVKMQKMGARIEDLQELLNEQFCGTEEEQ